MKEFIIEKNDAGLRLDKQLLKILSECNPPFIYKMLRKKNITLNGKKADGNERLNAGDTIRIYFSDETFSKLSGNRINKICEDDAGYDIGSFILYEDENIILLDKPSGLLSQKACEGDVSVNELCIRYLIDKGEISTDGPALFKPSVCNRLDRNTSGVIIFAKTYAASAAMSSLLKERTLDKYYKCIVKGQLRGSHRIEGYLVKDERNNTVKITENKTDNAAHIVTEYNALEICDEFTFLEVKLITGKSHQIRAHLAGTGYPILGDNKYGDRKLNDFLKRKYGINDQMLHSYKLVMPNELPECIGNLEGMSFEAPLPDDFKRLFNEYEFKAF